MDIKGKLFGHTKQNSYGVQALEMADARKGIIFFLGNTTCESDFSISDLGFTDAFVGTAVKEPIEDVMKLVRKKIKAVDEVAKRAEQKKAAMRDQVSDTRLGAAVKKIVDDISDQFKGRYGDAALEFTGSNLQILITNLTKTLADAIPVWGIVNDAAGVYSGLKKTGTSVQNAIRQVYAGWNVQLLNGHPSVISKALARHTAADAFRGIGSTALSSARLAGQFVSGGISALGNILIDIFLTIWRFFERVIQMRYVNQVLSDAKLAWETIGSSACFANHHDLFSLWYRKACVVTPIIGALSICSGFAGHPMRFLQLINHDLSAAQSSTGQWRHSAQNQASFDKGCRYIDEIKRQGGRWVKDYCANYSVKFEPTSPNAAGPGALNNYMGNKLREIQLGEPQGLIALPV